MNADQAFESVRVSNRHGTSPFVLICDHASNFVPAEFGTLGLKKDDLTKHIAWDPGAAPVAQMMSELMDAPLIESGISRLIIDCNRPLDAPDLIWEVSETTPIPGNQNLNKAQRAERVALAYDPFHTAIDELVETRLSQGRETNLVSIHSFTPVYKGVSRPWHIGILHDEDLRLSTPLILELQRGDDIVVGDNEPYSPADRVYFTLERHGRAHGLACVMIEIRNDEIQNEAAQSRWAKRLAEILGPEESGETKTIERPKASTSAPRVIGTTD
ncbi:N-formylglutamate amidohydrolase [Mesorhizobium denitrificans]